ncbi:MAG: hypothetical protein RR626_09545, partial [Anaerovoracaceae bacterium]
MKTDLVSKIVLFLCIALFLFLSFFALQYRGKASRDILLDDTTPDKVLTAIHRVFPQERLRCTADLHLEQFLKGSTAAFAYDVHALPLVHSNEQLRFYPLYTDCVVIALDADQVPTQVNGWEDLKTITQPVSFLSAKPELIYIWAALSHGYSGALDQNAISQSSIGLGSASSNPLE